MMFKLSFIVSMLLVSVHTLEIISTMTTKSPDVSSTTIHLNSRISLSPGTKASSTSKSERPNLTTSEKARKTLTSMITSSFKKTLQSRVTSETAKNMTTKTVTNGSTILNPKFNIHHFLFYVIFLLFFVYSG